MGSLPTIAVGVRVESGPGRLRQRLDATEVGLVGSSVSKRGVWAPCSSTGPSANSGAMSCPASATAKVVGTGDWRGNELDWGWGGTRAKRRAGRRLLTVGATETVEEAVVKTFAAGASLKVPNGLDDGPVQSIRGSCGPKTRWCAQGACVEGGVQGGSG